VNGFCPGTVLPSGTEDRSDVRRKRLFKVGGENFQESVTRRSKMGVAELSEHPRKAFQEAALRGEKIVVLKEALTR